MLEALRREFGEREWYERFLDAEIAPPYTDDVEEHLRQETNRWATEWLQNSQIGIDDIHMDRLRTAVTVPLDLVGSLVPGTREALAWCKAHGLSVVLVTNTLWRGDDEVRRDWERFGLGDSIDHVVSSHSIGWQKPHAAIFRRALELSGSAPEGAVMVRDRLPQDVWGAKRLGLTAGGRRPLARSPPQQSDLDPDPTTDHFTRL